MDGSKLRGLTLSMLLLLPTYRACADGRPPRIPAPTVPAIDSVWDNPKALVTSMFGPASPRLVALDSDLDEDGKVDWAGIVEWDGDDALIAQLFVLMRQADGSYKLTEISKSTDTYRSGVEGMEPESHGFQVTYTNRCGANCLSGSDLHFKLYKGQWRLVGRDDRGYYTDPDKETRESYNYLTGREVDEVMAKNGKIASSVVKRTDDKAILLRETGPLGP